MTLDELLGKIGVSDDKKAEAEKAFKDFLDGAYVPKSRFNEVNEEKKTLQATVSERDKQLEDLKKNAGDNADLKEQIKNLQEANKKAAADYEQKIKDTKLDAAIKIAVGSSAQDVDIVAGLIDRSKLILGDDGKVAGLDEQVKELQTSKAFLFKTDTGKPPYQPNGGGDPQKNPFAKETFNLTEQGKLFRENPEQARALAAAAGTKI